MIFWNYKVSWGQWNYVAANLLSGEESTPETCADYCLASDGCTGMAVTIYKPSPTSSTTYYCYVTYSVYSSGPDCWGTNCRDSSNMSHTIIFAVFRDYYESNPENLPTDTPDGTIGASYEEVEGVCDTTSTVYGDVNFEETKSVEYSSEDSKNIVREKLETNCAAQCFAKAGCSAFYGIDDGCTFIMGQPEVGSEASNIGESGVINKLCPNTAFTTTFSRKSEFYCLFFAPSDAGNIANDIVQENTGNVNTPLRTWSFRTEKDDKMLVSQYVSIDMPNTSGYYATYRPVWFTIETFVRVYQSDNGRRRRRASDQSELVPVGQFTLEDAFKIAKQATKDAKKAAKQRQIMPRTDEILADIVAAEEQATNFILNGEMELPEDTEVVATGPIETVEFVQTSNDGSVSADCISGSCNCSAGFIDNGNGCEEMTEEQAATTQAPTTTAAPVDPNVDYLQSLVGKLESVFEDNRPNKARTHLLTKWNRIRERMVQKYNRMKNNGCEYPETWSDDSVNFDSINMCDDIDDVKTAFGNWSETFTRDCNKVARGMEMRYHNRKRRHIQAVAGATTYRLGC